MKKTFVLLFALLVLAGSSGAQTTVQLGSGTSTNSVYPINSYYNYNYTQQIYLASEFQTAGATTGTINKIRFYVSGVNGTPYANWQDWTIYLGTTTKMAFSSATDWIPVGSMTQVFSGSIPTPVADSWVEITLTTPFNYSGNNLVVAVDENSAGYTTLSTVFYSYETGTNRGIRYAADVTNPDPATPPSANLNTSIAQIQFDMTLVACSGTPAPGNTLSTASPACPSIDFTLSLQNPTPGTGVLYQWESSADNITWVPVALATEPTLTTNQTSATWYHCIVSCSGNADTSTAIQLTMNSWLSCYCSSTSTLTTSYFNAFSTSGGTTNIDNTASGYSANGYGDFTGFVVSQKRTETINFTTSLTGTTVGVGIWVDWNQNGLFTDPGEEVYMTTGYVSTCSGSFTVPLTATLGGTRMRIRMDYGNSSPAICGLTSRGETEDYTFNVFAEPTCFTPTALVVGAVTDNDAIISWTTGGASLWNVEYGEAGFTPGTGTVMHGVTNPDTITGLSSATDYEFYVQDSCSASDVSSWSTPSSFTTACAIISVFPWTEGFESATMPDLPNCWLMNGGWVTTDNANDPDDADAHSGAQFLREAYSATNEFVWTPAFQLTAGTSYDFSFWWAGDEYANWTGDVFYNTDQASAGATQLGSSFVVDTTVTTFNYELVTYSITPSTSGTYYFGIRVNAPWDPMYLSFDDFTMEVTPNCPKPTLLNVASTTLNSAVLSWTTGGASIWNVEYGPEGFTPGTGTMVHNVTTNPYTINGLMHSTSYAFYVQDSCGVSDVSPWMGPFNFSTQCGSIIAFPLVESFDGVIYPPNCWSVEQIAGSGNWAFSSGETDPDCTPHTGAGMSFFNSFDFYSGAVSALITPSLDLPTDGFLVDFWMYRDNGYSTKKDSVSVYYNTTNSLSGATLLGTINRAIVLSPVEDTTGWYEYHFQLPAGSVGNGRYVIFQSVSAYGNNMYIDDVRIRPDTLTGIAETSEIAMTIMPNPNNGTFTVDFGGITGNTSLMIMDLTGKVMVKESLTLTGVERKTYDLSGFGKGIYNIRIVNSNNVAVRKIVVN